MYNKINLNKNVDGTYDVMIIYPNIQDTEFGLEFLKYEKIKNNISNIISYLKNRENEIKIKSVKIIFGTALIASFPFQDFMNIYGAEVSKYSMGYLYSGTTSEQISYISRTNNSINAVSPSYFDINADGSINVNISGKELIEYAHSQGLKVIPFLSNHWNRQAGVAALQNAETLSTQIANYLETYNLDGINVDIENVTETERDLYTNFVALLRQKVPIEKEISVAVAANPNGWSVGWHGSYDYTNLANNSNYLMLMAYDEHWQGSEQGPVASISFVENSIKYALSKTTADKVVLGIPLYGRIWSDDNNFNGNGVTLQKIEKLISDYNATVTYDDTQKSPKATFTVNAEDVVNSINGKTLTPGTYTVWYENEKSIAEKISLINTYNLKGSSVWALGQEPVAIWQDYSRWLNNITAVTPSTSENTTSITTPTTTENPINKAGLITATILNVRSAPSIGSSIIGTLKKGTSVNILTEQNGWYSIKLASGATGYISSNFVTLQNTPISSTTTDTTAIQKAGIIATSVLNVRSSPSTNSRILTTLKRGTSVNILESKNGWYTIKLASGKTGYINSKYVNVNSANATSTAKTGVVTTSILNVRSSASIRGKILTFVRKGSNVSILSSQNGWYKVRLSNGTIGYVSSNYISVK